MKNFNAKNQPIHTLPNLVTLEMLVQIAYLAGVLVNDAGRSKSKQEAVEALVAHNMVKVENDKVRITERGTYYINHLMTVPLPVQIQAFIIPERTVELTG